MRNNKGFTLLELILVIAVIALLAGAVFVAVDPAKRFEDSNNSVRSSDIDNILQAIKKYQADEEGLLPTGVDTSLKMLGTDNSGCDVACPNSTGGGTDTTNLAPGGTESASSSYGIYPANNLNDENSSTFWLHGYPASPHGQWWQIDLGSQTSINKAVVEWYNSAGSFNCTDFTIEGSNNGSDFNIVYGPVDTSGDPQLATYNFTSSTYQYWRFVCNTAVGVLVVVRETELYEALPEETASSCLDIDSEISYYIKPIPEDPEIGDSGKTYYAIKEIGNGAIVTVACNAQDTVIESSR